MPVTRYLPAVCGALLALSASAQVGRPRAPDPFCPAQPAECRINVQAFDFGRASMSQSAPPVNGFNTISVTCTRAFRDGLEVAVEYELKAVPASPGREMRDSDLATLSYDMFIDPTRQRYWGDGQTGGTFAFRGLFDLNDRSPVATNVHQLYGKVDGGQVASPGHFLGLVGAQLQYQAVCVRRRR
jgi:spore coat protein U-like protein